MESISTEQREIIIDALEQIKTTNSIRTTMSTAELTAHRIFDSYRFQNLPSDVRRHIAILCLSTPSESEEDIANACTLSEMEKRARANQALEDAKTGRSYSTAEICRNLDSKYPWLCK